MKIVINRCFGGFQVSLAAARLMADMGDDEAKEAVKEYDSAPTVDKFGNQPMWYGYFCDDDRANPALVAAVEELGDDASTNLSELVVVEIPDDVDWYISEYDGIEEVHERHRSWP